MVIDGLFRGEDSTGVFQIQRNRQVFSTKLASHAYHLFATDEWTEFGKRMVSSSRIVVGHNRKATQGAVTSENAHPFHEDHITLVHNGTLRDHKKLLADVDVDSHAVARAFAQRPAEEVLKEIDGAFTFVWYDASTERLNVIRNEERPMNLIKTRDFYCLSSETSIAQIVLGRRTGVTIESTITLKPGVLYSFDLQGDYTTKEVELKKVYQYNAQAARRASYDAMDDGDIPWPYPTYTRPTSLVTLPSQHQRRAPFTHKDESFRETLESDCVDCAYDSKTEATYPRNVGVLTGRSVASSLPGNNRPVLLTAVKGEFQEKDMIMVKLTSIYKDGGRWKCIGTTFEPGKHAVDVIGWLSGDVKPETLVDWYADYVLGVVVRVNMTVNGGPSITVDKLQLETQFETHNKQIGSCEWAYVVDNEVCSHCSAELDPLDHEFTSVTRTGINENAAYKITCPDCIASKLLTSNKEIYDSFEQRRYSALQERESISSSAIENARESTEGSGAPTVH